MTLHIAFVAMALLLLGGVGVIIVRSLVVAQPDEWLLRIRNGRLVDAGVGIVLWRRPGDVVARFTSTMQRVGFSTETLSNDRVRVEVEGFILWSVSPERDAPFRAFRKLGVVNLDAPPPDLRSRKHLLSTPQHRAFQRLLAAAVQGLAATMSLEELLLRQEALVSRLRTQLEHLEREVGMEIDQVQLLRVRPSDAELLRQMSARTEEGVRQEAASARLQVDERIKTRELEAKVRLAREEAAAREQELEQEKGIRITQLQHEAEIKRREREAAREHALSEEAQRREVAAAIIEREELELAARLDRIRREAEAKRDAIDFVTSAEEKKSQAVRDHELSQRVAEEVGQALKHLPLKEARWVSIGNESPAASLAGLITAAGELATKTARNGG